MSDAAGLDDYNLLISRAFTEVAGQFAAVASPTLSKQETVTFLYQRIVDSGRGRSGASTALSRVALRIEFAARLFLKLLAVLVASRRFRVRSIPRHVIYFRSWLVPRSFRGGTVVDDYFRRLVDDLIAAGSDVVVGLQPLGLRDYVTGFGDARVPAHFVIPVGLLSLPDVLGLFADFVRAGRVRLRGPHLFRGVDVTGMLNDSLDRDYFQLRSFQAYLDSRITGKLSAFEPRAFVYVFENQSWEKACLRVLAQSRTICVAYQSSGFSNRFLNFFPTAIDREQSAFPSRILTVGDLFRDVLRSQGRYPIPVETFAAMRFDYPVSGDRYTVKEPRTQRFGRILYAFAVHEYQYRGIVRDLIEAFGGSDIEVVLKFHPLHERKYQRMRLPPNFRPWAAQSGELRDVYDAVIFNDNSYGFEALMQGVKTFEYTCESVYDDHRLYGFDGYDCVLDLQRLMTLRQRMEAAQFDKTYPVDAVAKYLNHAFRPYSPDSCRTFASLVEAGRA